MALADTISSLGTSIINLVNKRAKCDLSNINSDGEDVIRALAGGTGVPTGTVIAYMGTTVPDGFLLMDGRVLSQETYADLYSVVGVSQLPSGATESSGVYTWTSGGITYSTGAGTDDATHKYKMFAIADMTDGRYLMGSTVAGSRGAAMLPDLYFDLAFRRMKNGSSSNFYSHNFREYASSADTSGYSYSAFDSGSTKTKQGIEWLASASQVSGTKVYGKGNYVRPLNCACKFIISY